MKKIRSWFWRVINYRNPLRTQYNLLKVDYETLKVDSKTQKEVDDATFDGLVKMIQLKNDQIADHQKRLRDFEIQVTNLQEAIDIKNYHLDNSVKISNKWMVDALKYRRLSESADKYKSYFDRLVQIIAEKDTKILSMDPNYNPKEESQKLPERP